MILLRSYLMDRLAEASTWRALIMFFCGAIGVQISDADATTLVAAGSLLSGIIGAFLPDNFNKD